MKLGKFRSSESFDVLVEKRRAAGFETYGVVLDNGEKVDKAVLIDTSWEAVEQIADSVHYLRFEVAKVGSRGLRAERQRLQALEKALSQIEHDLFEYRKRMLERAPDLVNTDEE